MRNCCRFCAGTDEGLGEAVETEAVAVANAGETKADAVETEALEALLALCLGDFRAIEYGLSEGAEGVRGDAEWPVGEEDGLRFRLKRTSRARSCCR